MDWIRSELVPFSDPSKTVSLVHFDCVESPITPGTVFTDYEEGSLDKCQDLLGSVLWLDAAGLFLRFLETHLHGDSTKSVHCLGEGTGAVGCALKNFGFEKVYISDLPDLLPLMKINSKLAGPSVEAIALDWTGPLPQQLYQACDIVIGCEVLYGNRFVWEGLIETIINSLKPKSDSVVYLCVTLRNERHDLEDFQNDYLKPFFRDIHEFPLSETVSVLRARNLQAIELVT
jgi:hypothetical protein